eukprot:13709899-Alexandrium_andersonii.AAC.1
MSASLVGSEMCIRDRVTALRRGVSIARSLEASCLLLPLPVKALRILRGHALSKGARRALGSRFQKQRAVGQRGG